MIDRYLAIEHVVKHVDPEDILLSTTGMISRELFVTEDRPGNFYMLGSMGLLSSFGLGLALLVPQRRVLILEGDGSAMMSLGTLPLIASERPANLTHIILDNEAYESTGCQPSISSSFEIAKTAASVGYPSAKRVADLEDLERALIESRSGGDLSVILVKVGIAPVENIPRISHAPTEIRERLKTHIRSSVQQK